jgi:nitroreductase/dihydropteridine reductase
VKSILKMAPSSTNLQPWHFVNAKTEEGKKRTAKGTEGDFHFNTQR